MAKRHRNVTDTYNLAVCNPELASQWSSRNLLKPTDVTKSSNRKAYWNCPLGHEWEAIINSRHTGGNGCPYCSGHLVNHENCLATRLPDLAKEWASRNSLKPSEVSTGSSKKVWWTCDKGHEWQTSVNKRTNGYGCPYCCGQAVNHENCLSTRLPDLAKQWSSRNILKPSEVTPGSSKKVWWTCDKGHEWESQVCNRSITGCPYCSNKAINETNCLEFVRPDLAKQWSSRNILRPSEVTPGSPKRAWWTCDKGHEWEAVIQSRGLKEYGCPYCSGRLPTDSSNLEILRPDLAKEWSSRNKLKPSEVTVGSQKRIWWTCNKGHEWQVAVCHRSGKRSRGCPICNESRGEKSIKKWLESKNIYYQRQYRFERCKYKMTLPFDFCALLPGKDPLLIEYQGIQHYKAVPRFGGDEALVKVQMLDQIKRDFVERFNLPYLEIPYTDLDRIGELLEEAIAKLPLRRKLKKRHT